MKTILRIAVSILFTYALLNLTACNPSANRVETAQLSDDFEEDRIEIADDLRELREDINDRIESITQRMEKVTDDAQQEMSDLREDLAQKRDAVDAELESVVNATSENWNEVQGGARSTYQNVKKEFNALGNRLRD